MLFKIALRNVRRSARDYAIYFITVMLGVAMFYAFNAISDQAVLFDALSADSMRMIGLLNTLIGLFSGAIAFVLGFLVVYANRFLIRRRKREFGTYLVLGMGSGRVSRILLCETAIVGVASLVVGLAVGIAVSQGLSFVTAALMGATMSKYQLIVSSKAVLLTAACFLVVFAVSAVVNIVYIGRCRLVKLLSPHQGNETSGKFNVPVRAFVFVLSVALLAAAYWQLNINGMEVIDEHFVTATALMIVGTFLFFWSVSGFAVALVGSVKGVYYKGISMFTVRQVSSKINSAFASMAVVCVMLFFALATTSIGMGLVKVFVGNLEETTAYDMTITTSPAYMRENPGSFEDAIRLYEEYHGDIAACITDRCGSWDSFVRDYAQLDYYGTGITYAELLSTVPNIEGILSDTLSESSQRLEVKVIGVSQYNAQCRLLGKQGITLAGDECAVNNLMQGTAEAAKALVGNRVQFAVAGTTLHFSGKVLGMPMRTTAVSDVVLEVVVPDSVTAVLAEQGPASVSSLNLMYSVDRVAGDDQFARYMYAGFPVEADGEELILGAGYETDPQRAFAQYGWPVFSYYSGQEMADQASGLRMVISYLALYIGFVLLVATAAILAIQQLSETADSMPRYRRLATLGCDTRAILESLRTQTVVYFLAPLVLAACHTACVVAVVSRTLFLELGIDVLGSIALCVTLVVLVYGIYLLATYLLSKSFVRTVAR